MNSNIVRSSGPHPALLSSLPEVNGPLASSTADVIETALATDAERDRGLTTVDRVAVWQPPYENTEAMRRDARTWLQVYQSRQQFDAERAFAWLMEVGKLTNTNARIGLDDMAEKARSYLAMMSQYPAVVFCWKSAGLAARTENGWFPSWDSLAGFLDGYRGQLATKAERMFAIADGKTTRRIGPARLAEPTKRVPPTEEEKAAVAETLRKMREVVGHTPFRASLRPEDDHKGFQPIARTKPPVQVSGVPGQQPAVPSNEGAKSDMAPKSKARSFGEGENGPSLSPASDAQEGAA